MKKLGSPIIIVLLLGGLLGGLLGLFMIGGLFNLELSSLFRFIFSSPSVLFNALVILAVFALLGSVLSYVLLVKKVVRETIYSLGSALDANKAKDEFISMLLHFIRTPLSGIRWSLKEMIEEETAEEKKAGLMRLYTENLGALNAVERLLDVSRASMDNIVFDFEVLSIKEFIKFVEDTIIVSRSQAKEKNISINIRITNLSKNSIKIDKAKILLAIETLFENALLYTPKDGSINVVVGEKKSAFVFSISDTGMGISDKDKSKIFLQFFRGKNARYKFPGGFGVGLYIVKTFIEKHKGKILFVSKEGEGTTFTFRLPMITNPTESFFEKI